MGNVKIQTDARIEWEQELQENRSILILRLYLLVNYSRHFSLEPK